MIRRPPPVRPHRPRPHGPILLAAAGMLLPAPPATAGLERGTERALAITCADLAAVLERFAAAPPASTGLVFEAPVAKVERDGALMLTYVCGGKGPTAVCLEYRSDAAIAGETVRVEGVVSGSWDRGPVLEPCATRSLKTR